MTVKKYSFFDDLRSSVSDEGLPLFVLITASSKLKGFKIDPRTGNPDELPANDHG